ncbi:BspA family leucine-rich repeat surface protein [Halorutilales archaeon Cl-col2-1]
MSGEESESASDMEDLLQENGTAELVEKLDESSEDIVELIELLQVVQDLSEDLTPEVKEVVYENREEIESLRSAFEKEETLVLLKKLGENSDNVVEMLDMLDAAQEFSEDLTPEVKKVVYENREVIEDLRSSFEKEETLVLLQKLGENSDNVIEMLDMLDAGKDFAEDLAPEVKKVVYENREEIEKLRSAFEKEETLVLLQKLGENTDNVIEMLDMLDAAQAFAEDLTPEVKKVVYENREVIEDLRESLEKEETIELLKKLGENTEGVLMTMELLDGLHDASQEIDAEMYEIGETLGQLFILLDTFKDPATVESFNNALQVFAEPEEKQKDYRLSVLGLLKLPFDKEVRQALGLFVEAARRMVR